ncbi:hypothetical protein BGX27_002665 [Mortierella sp. AM989]|nr:hypothetical protein BGX27_002665 [Mortierella sp. AM989]
MAHSGKQARGPSHQGEHTLQFEQMQRRSVHELATQNATSPRVTTAVTMTATPTSVSSRAAVNVTGSTSEQDEVEVRGLSSPGLKRARVQTGSRENLAAETSEKNAPLATRGRRGNHVRIPQPQVAPIEISNGEANRTERDDASNEERENRHSFTSPEPMLSPIQSYFGSDPNSPASSFSLPRHDHYPRLAIDSSASMDGYHGFATHPWSEQSTTPSRALSHRWTRRSSQSDANDSHNSNETRNNADIPTDSSSRQHRSSIVLSRPFAPSAIDQPWVVASSTVSDMSISRTPDEIYEGEQDLASDELMHDSNDEATVGSSHDGHENSHNLRDSDDDEILDEGEIYQRGYRFDPENFTVNGEDDEDDEDGDDYGNRSDEDDIEARLEDDISRVDDDDEMDDEMDEEAHVSSSYRRQDGTNHSPSSHSFLNGIASHRQGSRRPTLSAGGDAQTNESDEALARRLQEEEYTAMLGERIQYKHNIDRYRFGDEASPAIESQYYLPQELTSGSGSRDREISRSSSDAEITRPGRMSRPRSAFIGSHSTTPSRYIRQPVREPSRSPSATLSLSARAAAAERDYRALTRDFELRFTSNRTSGAGNMWGNPADYLNDDQVDDSYEGLLRLGERIGDVKPKGVQTDVLRTMDKHVVSWRHLKSKKRPLERNTRHNNNSPAKLSFASSSSPRQEDTSQYSVYSQYPYPLRSTARSHGPIAGSDDASIDEPSEEK